MSKTWDYRMRAIVKQDQFARIGVSYSVGKRVRNTNNKQEVGEIVDLLPNYIAKVILEKTGEQRWWPLSAIELWPEDGKKKHFSENEEYRAMIDLNKAKKEAQERERKAALQAKQEADAADRMLDGVYIDGTWYVLKRSYFITDWRTLLPPNGYSWVVEKVYTYGFSNHIEGKHMHLVRVQ